jgi:uncharacterized protein YecE (DUF72 family)
MTEPLMIGTRGWAHVAWTGGFYPPELPADWCFCYYSNQLRSVLVPQETWEAVSRAEVVQWMEDSDPAFRFVLELPAALCVPLANAKRDQVLAEFLELAEPIDARTAGLLLRIAPDTPVYPDWFEHLLGRLADVAPVCADLPDVAWRAAAVLDALTRQNAGLAWHCAQEAEPRPGGRLLVALGPPATPRQVRHCIERLAQWQGGQGAAGLFFDVPEGAAKAAQEARIIAELMGV